MTTYAQGIVRLAAAALSLCLAAPSYAAAPKTAPDDLRRLQLNKEAGLTIVDVRPPAEFAKNHIQGALSIPAAGIDLANLPRDGRIVVYCPEAACPLSSMAADALISKGHRNISLLDGGLAEWLKRGYPIEAGTPLPAGRQINRTAAERARERMAKGELLILDVRPALEFSAGHLPGARSVPLETLADAVAGLEKNKDVLVYDRLAERGRQAAEKLAIAGFKVTELAGGIAGWVKHKLPLEVE